MKYRKNKIRIFCTLGPSSMNKEVITKLDNIGIDMFRINLSHTDIDELENIILKIKRHTDKPVCLDTEGAQIRVGKMTDGRVKLLEGNIVRILKKNIIGNAKTFSFNPNFAIDCIKPGDLISIDFDSVLLKVVDCALDGISAIVISGGIIGSNKAVSVDRRISLPSVSEKDKKAINMGLDNDIKYYALSFANCKNDVEYMRSLVGKSSHIISKIESKKGVDNVNEILEATDSLLIDRGDLSREEDIEKIPYIQKAIIKKANKRKIPVYIATNLLESMVSGRNPTRAEMNDIANTLCDGADGLVLAAETAIGRYPVNCARMVAKSVKQFLNYSDRRSLNALRNHNSSMLVEPHGGILVNRMLDSATADEVRKFKILKVDEKTLLDLDQIAVGSFSPLEGFMDREDLISVINGYRLKNGIAWTLPILFQVGKEDAKGLGPGQKIAIAYEADNEIYALMRLEEVYKFDLDKLARGVFATNSPRHPGIKALKSKGDHFLAGKIDMIKRPQSAYGYYAITPTQSRTIFENKGWAKVIGFHTRNAVHRIHEHIQLSALDKFKCDGVFIHPVIGPKKSGDYRADIIMKSYEWMLKRHYPSGKFLLGAFNNYSRYAGPREAVFTAICRKNFGCSHFILGRDHTGVGKFYKSSDVKKIFEKIGEMGITPIFFNKIGYCRSCKKYVEQCKHGKNDLSEISGSDAREILRSSQYPPEWFMRKEISRLILRQLKHGNSIFVE